MISINTYSMKGYYIIVLNIEVRSQEYRMTQKKPKVKRIPDDPKKVLLFDQA